MKKIYLLIIILITLSFAEKPTVAILYFKDRTILNSKIDLNKALTDIIITELTNQSSFKIIEREDLEKIAQELDLSDSYLVDQSTAPRVGKVLGATYIFTGSYMIEDEDILIMMKMIRVETGEIVAGKNITGKILKFSKMIGKISKSALKMLEKEGSTVTIIKHKTSKISIEDVKEYNSLLKLKDAGKLDAARKRIQMLSNNFSYASNTLLKIENELKEIDKVHKEKINKIQNSNKMSYKDFISLTTTFMMEQNYKELYKVCNKARKYGINMPSNVMMTEIEFIEYYSIMASNLSKKWKLVISDGTAFIKVYPKSMYYSIVRMYVKTAISEIKKEKKLNNESNILIKDIQIDISSHNKNYLIANIYYEKQLYKKACKYYEKIKIAKTDDSITKSTKDKILFEIFMSYYNIRDFKKVKEIYSNMQNKYPNSVYTSSTRSIMEYVNKLD